MKNIFLILASLFIFNFSFAGSGQQAVRVVTGTVTNIAGSSTSSSSPTVSFTIAAGKYCDMKFSFYAQAANSATMPIFFVDNNGGGTTYLVMSNMPIGTAAPYTITNYATGVILDEGSYRFALLTGSISASSGNVYYSGFCRSK